MKRILKHINVNEFTWKKPDKSTEEEPEDTESLPEGSLTYRRGAGKAWYGVVRSLLVCFH